MSDPSYNDAGSGSDSFGASAAEASASVAGVGAAAAATAAQIDAAFAKAGTSLAQTLAKAASDGKISLGELASAALSAFEVFARTPGSGGDGKSLVGALTDTFSSVFQARADGGPVTSGGAYLVGERGPEVFRPSTAGDIGPLGSGGTTVNVTVQGGGAPSILRSEAQIAAALARAVRLGAG